MMEPTPDQIRELARVYYDPNGLEGLAKAARSVAEGMDRMERLQRLAQQAQDARKQAHLASTAFAYEELP